MDQATRKLVLVWLRQLNHARAISNGRFGPHKETLLYRALEREQSSFMQVMNRRINARMEITGVQEVK